MKIDWRVSAIAAGSAFLLSVLVGVIGNVSFGVLILRAVVAAAVFGAGAIGASLVIDRYLPELKNSSSAQADASDGAGVDIVVEGDDDLQNGVFGPEIAHDASHVESEAEEGDEELGELSPVDQEEEESIAEDVAESGSGASDIPVNEDEVIEEVEEADDESDVVELEEAEEEPGGGNLPDVDSMSDSFTELPLAEETIDDSSDSGEDPALMARAIRTVLKREE